MCNTCESDKSFVNNASLISKLSNNLNLNVIQMTPISLVEKMNETQYNKNFLSKIRENVENQFNNNVMNMERRLRQERNEVDNYRGYLSRAIERVKTLEDSLEALKLPKDATATKIASEIVKIKSLEKVEEVLYGENKLTFLTKFLYLYDANEDKYYEGARYLITVYLDEANIRITSDNLKQGYWTSQDPHPHVDGNNGRPCLGSIESSVAELCGNREYMVLACLLIDYVESVNTNDIAGRSVRFRNQVNPETGEIVEESEQPLEDCPSCDHVIHSEDEYRTCEECGGDICEHCCNWVGSDDDTLVCSHCRENYYSWHGDAEVYIHNDRWDAFCEQWNEEGE
jgi:hypothetical protein